MRNQILPLRRGLATLMGNGGILLDDARAMSVVLGVAHPFDLATDANVRYLRPEHRAQAQIIHLLAEPIFFEYGTNKLIEVARGLAGAPAESENGFRYFRKISSPDNVNDPGKGEVLRFYEIGTYFGVFIAGGRASEGNLKHESGKMDAAFGLLSMVYGVPFDEHIEIVDEEDVLDKLHAIWNHHKNRAA